MDNSDNHITDNHITDSHKIDDDHITDQPTDAPDIDIPTDVAGSDVPVGADRPLSDRLAGDLSDGEGVPLAAVPPVQGTATGTRSDGAGERPSVETLRLAAGGIVDDIGKKLNDPTAVYVALGASDLVAARARKAAAGAARQGAEFAEKARAWNAQASAEASDVPRLAVSRALKVAGHVEAAYSDLATRGREVAERVRGGRGGSDLVRRAVLTLSRGTIDPAVGRPGTIVAGETVAAGNVDPTVVVEAIEIVPPIVVVEPSDDPAPVVVVDALDESVDTDKDPITALDPVELTGSEDATAASAENP